MGSSRNVVITTTARSNLVRARAGDLTLPPIVGIALGDGGVDSSGEPVPPSQDQTTLTHELLRKPVNTHTYPSATTCRYECVLTGSELAGIKISELGLYDSEGDMVCIKTFYEKRRDEEIEMTFTVDDEF